MPLLQEIRTQEIITLRSSLRRPDLDRDQELRRLVGRPIRSIVALREWHDLLTFLLAYPQDAAEHRMVRKEFRRILELVRQMVRTSTNRDHELTNSGIAGTTLQSTYSLEIMRWLVGKWPDDAVIFSATTDVDLVRQVLREAVHSSEREALDRDHGDGERLLRSVIGADMRALDLIALMDRVPCSEEVRSTLFELLKVYVSLSGRGDGPNRSLPQGPAYPVFHHRTGLERTVVLPKILEQPIAGPLPLTGPQREALIDSARSVLCSMHRETDPITYAGHVEFFDMGRGLRIALFTLQPSHRLPYEAYVGFMGFKNRMSMAYGGAWVFPGRSKVGINVFPAYRGGESAWFFAQLLRLYTQRYGVERFEAENYQLGHGNPEGLRSGAYWFYYRSGFRPADPHFANMAEKEFRKMKEGRGYNAPLRVMRQLVAEGMEFAVADTDIQAIDTMQLTLAIQAHIVHTYGADRNVACQAALKKLMRSAPLGRLSDWKGAERAALENWALLLDAAGGIEEWSGPDRRALRALVRSKVATTETGHVNALRQHHALLGAAQRMVNAFQA